MEMPDQISPEIDSEYLAANPVGYSYSRFCELYRSFEKTLSVTMRQTHAAGERLFADYAGDGVSVVAFSPDSQGRTKFAALSSASVI